MALLLPTLLLLALAPSISSASPAPAFPITASPPIPTHLLRARQDPDTDNAVVHSVCGYQDNDPKKPWRAPSSSQCMVDATASAFGFCHTSVTDVKDCKIKVACIDAHTCSGGGCGNTNILGGLTVTCSGDKDYCYTDYLQTGSALYTNIACDNKYRTQTLSMAKNLLPSTTSTQPSASASASATPTPSSPTSSQTSAAGSPSSTAGAAALNSISSNTGAIAGGVVGGLAVLAAACLGFYFIKRKTGKAKSTPYEYSNDLGTAGRSAPPAVYYKAEADTATSYHELPASETQRLNKAPAELSGGSAYVEMAGANRSSPGSSAGSSERKY